jgi:hypothetical protein
MRLEQLKSKSRQEQSAVASPEVKRHLQEFVLGPILQNSFSAESFSDKFSASYLGLPNFYLKYNRNKFI